MLMELHTQIMIRSTPAKVWSILTDFPAYPSWNPFIISINGRPAVGERLEVRMQPPDAARMTFKPKVTAFQVNEKFQWLGHFIIPGIFDGEHTFALEAQPDGTVLFSQSEHFSGLFVAFFRKMLNDNTRRGFEAMNQKLKERAERN